MRVRGGDVQLDLVNRRVVAQHRLERGQAAVVHVGRRLRHVAQTGHAARVAARPPITYRRPSTTPMAAWLRGVGSAARELRVSVAG
jgi:hypothetical protein